MGYNDCVRIERAANGFTVSMRDYTVVTQNMKNDAVNRNRKGNAPYLPWLEERKEYVFTDFDSMSKFIKENLEKALPKDPMGDTFDRISAPED